jgi:DNA-binding XRE family transcriptional regulator
MPASVSPARLRAAREAAGLSRERVAVEVDRSWRAIYSYEDGTNTPPVPVLVRLCELYRVKVDDVLDNVKVPS